MLKMCPSIVLLFNTTGVKRFPVHGTTRGIFRANVPRLFQLQVEVQGT